MARLTAADRRRIPPSEYGLPKQKAYPIEDRGHAIDAKARATEEERRGDITPSQRDEIDHRADAMLARAKNPEHPIQRRRDSRVLAAQPQTVKRHI